MGTTTIYRINETDRTINIAQSVNDTDESVHGAVLNMRTFTFDELMNQHRVFCEHTEPYDAFVRRYKKILVEAGVEKYHPAEFDEFMQAKQERMDDMDKLKKRLIRNGLPTTELIDLSAKFKAEIKALAEELVERFGKKG